MSQGGDY